MPPPDPDFVALLNRVRCGCPQAVRELIDSHSQAIRRIIQTKLDHRLQVLYEPEDFLQIVWMAFFSAVLPRQSFQSSWHLAAFLRRMAAHKILDANRRHLDLGKADLASRESLDDAVVTEHEPPDPDPTPEDNLASEEEWQQLRRDLPRAYREIIPLLRKGYTRPEIADRLGTCPRTVRRILHGLRRSPCSAGS